MSPAHDPDEGFRGRVFLVVLGFGLAALGFFGAVTMTMDEDAGPYDGLYGLAVLSLGLVAVAGAAIGRALARWTLLGIGLAFLAQATLIVHDVVADRSGLDRFTMAFLIGLVLVGGAACIVAAWHVVAHWRRMRAEARA
ncbi:MAG: hypothetical protein QM711_15040 [Micropruina sp.]|uniref:hypothetical protein n=1 Tax=Micropruina sp. TaxID=2737536 RepID=UPI0039E29CEF